MKDRKADAFSQALAKRWTARFGLVILAALTVVFLLAGGAAAQSAGQSTASQVIAGNIPGFVAIAKKYRPRRSIHNN